MDVIEHNPEAKFSTYAFSLDNSAQAWNVDYSNERLTLIWSCWNESKK